MFAPRLVGNPRRALPKNVSNEASVTITPYRDGPLLVRGPFVLVDQEGNEIPVERKVIALCRCGKSRTKPLCDGTHKVSGWRAASGS